MKIRKSIILCAAMLASSMSLLYAKGVTKPCAIESKFKVVVGTTWPFNGGFLGGVGKWGQPGAPYSKGRYSIEDDYASSSVTIKSFRPALWNLYDRGGSCNTINNKRAAGTIELYLRCGCACPGKYDVKIYGNINFTGTGPDGGCYGNLSYVNVHGDWTLIVQKTGTTENPFLYGQTNHFTANVCKDWALVARYTPTIGIPAYHKKQSTGTASGFIQLISATKK
jgi:hypothetical protein